MALGVPSSGVSLRHKPESGAPVWPGVLPGGSPPTQDWQLGHPASWLQTGQGRSSKPALALQFLLREPALQGTCCPESWAGAGRVLPGIPCKDVPLPLPTCTFSHATEHMERGCFRREPLAPWPSLCLCPRIPELQEWKESVLPARWKREEAGVLPPSWRLPACEAARPSCSSDAQASAEPGVECTAGGGRDGHRSEEQNLWRGRPFPGVPSPRPTGVGCHLQTSSSIPTQTWPPWRPEAEGQR